jgi:hypothetical protein
LDIPGNVHCIGGFNLEGVNVTATDSQGSQTNIITDQNGNFNFPSLTPGIYTLKFQYDNLYNYDTTQLNTIMENMTNIIHGVTVATTAELIAYDVLNTGVLSTLDIVAFIKLKDQTQTVNDIVLPWRFIKTADLEDDQPFISDEMTVDLTAQDVNSLDITAIYFGDPFGEFCD